jgi:nucleoside-diphosphate-sugar epimerase
MVGYDKKNIILGKYPPGYPMRPFESDQPFIVLDYQKIKKAFGWEPSVSLEDGLKRDVSFWQSALSK